MKTKLASISFCKILRDNNKYIDEGIQNAVLGFVKIQNTKGECNLKNIAEETLSDLHTKDLSPLSVK